VQINFAAREVAIKLVYYGPALSGKTTNLKALHELIDPSRRGRLMTLDTRDDRTLFFDMLPLVFKSSNDSGAMSLRVKVFTVPGQVVHASTRRLVLQGADGIVFVADSQISETEHNAESFLDLRTNIKEMGRVLSHMPLVIQFNKRDLPAIRTDSELEELAARGKDPVFKACALTGAGVLESFYGIVECTWRKLEAEHALSSKIGVDPKEFMDTVATTLGYSGRADALAKASVGGAKP